MSGRFTSADTVQNNPKGMDPYAYVGDNPVVRNDPTGHCWPWCTALAGAAIGAIVGVAVSTVTSVATTGKLPSVGEVAQAAVAGAVSGAIIGVVGPGASVAAAVGIGAVSGGVSSMAGKAVSNAVTGKSVGDGLVESGIEGALIGGATGGLLKAGAPLLGKVGGALGKTLRTVAGNWFSLDLLQDTDNFASGALKHFFMGDINARGQAGGYHYTGIPDAPGNIIAGTETPPNANGVYQGNVEVSGVPKRANGGVSTFFPDWMSPQDVVDSINEAFNNSTFVSGNTYNGPTSAGFNITFYLNRMNQIKSAYPDY